MAVDAVWSELLLCDQFPLTGKSTGNFLDFGLVASAGSASIALYSGHLLDFSSQSSM
jgi:hypothetical protein